MVLQVSGFSIRYSTYSGVRLIQSRLSSKTVQCYDAALDFGGKETDKTQTITQTNKKHIHTQNQTKTTRKKQPNKQKTAE